MHVVAAPPQKCDVMILKVTTFRSGVRVSDCGKVASM